MSRLVYTAQMSVGKILKGNVAYKFLDITAKTKDGMLSKLLAPPWQLVTLYKYSGLGMAAYTAAYLDKLNDNKLQILSLLDEIPLDQHIVAACYCGVGKFCHRHLAMRWLSEVSNITDGGELTRDNYKELQMVEIDGLIIRPEEDGITHINIYSKGKTKLGVFLSNFTKSSITTQEGTFESLEGYYHWLKNHEASNSIKHVSRDLFNTITNSLDALRHADGLEAKSIGSELRRLLIREGAVINNVPSSIFTEKFREAMHFKIEHSELKDEFIANELPYVHYYYYTNTNSVVYKDHFKWLSDIANTISMLDY